MGYCSVTFGQPSILETSMAVFEGMAESHTAGF